jgi:hypothetical protein
MLTARGLPDFPTADQYIDFVTSVLAAANELLLDKLKLICSAVLRKFGWSSFVAPQHLLTVSESQ